jgi:hypothetical protein
MCPPRSGHVRIADFQTRHDIERRELMKKPDSYTSVCDAIADTPGQAANLRARTELMRQVAAYVKKQG